MQKKGPLEFRGEEGKGDVGVGERRGGKGTPVLSRGSAGLRVS